MSTSSWSSTPRLVWRKILNFHEPYHRNMAHILRCNDRDDEGMGTVDANRAICPNCGHRLVRLRTDRQRAGQREAELEWWQCAACGHVQLQRWSFVDSASNKTVDEAALTQEKLGGAHKGRMVGWSGRSATAVTMAIAAAVATVAGLVAHRHRHRRRPRRHSHESL